MHKFAALLPTIMLVGCASITGSKLQPISVQTIKDNKEVAGIGCTLTNDEGKWFVTTPGSVTVHKSTADLAVDCKDDSHAGHENIVSKANGPVWGNIIVGGLVGYVVDRNTGAGFDYQNTITVVLRKIGEVVATSSTDAAKPTKK